MNWYEESLEWRFRYPNGERRAFGGAFVAGLLGYGKTDLLSRCRYRALVQAEQTEA